MPGTSIQNVTLASIDIPIAGGGLLKHANIIPAEQETDYPEYIKFSVLPAYGLY